VPDPYRFFITCARGVEDLLLGECTQHGIRNAECTIGGVAFSGELADAWRMCLWSRVGSRVLLRLDEAEVADDDALYRFVQGIDWSRHVDAAGSIAINCATSHPVITNSHYAALRVKDAIVDQLRANTGRLPSVNKLLPDVRINVYLGRSNAILYIDLSGQALHMRGYRQASGEAPLRETLAAAMLYRCKWQAIAERGGAFVDIMCGSATLLIEAAMIAGNIAPQRRRERFGFEGWLQHDAPAWNRIRPEAHAVTMAAIPTITGFEKSGRLVAIARENLERAGLERLIEIRQADSLARKLPLPGPPGLMLTNPPYGKRLGSVDPLRDTYFRIGRCLKQQFAGWEAALLTSENSLAQCVGLRAHHRNTLYNGALKCTLYQYRVRETQEAPADERNSIHALHDNAVMLKNRLEKNRRHLERWAKRNSVSCYRLYDADLPQYAVAIDIYDGEFVVQEYQAPKEISPGRAMVHLNDVIEVIQQLYDCKRDAIIVKTRKRQSGSSQYTGIESSGKARTVMEDGLRFEINLHDYIDTGLFLDHRETRRLVRRLAKGRKVLNLFAYTGSFSVYAAAGGAARITTVDMSNTYLDWARRNMTLNGFDIRANLFVRTDCLQWMHEADTRYQLIILDPPTFSNSKKMEATLDINRDHVRLVRQAMKLLDEEGVLLFSTNSKRFRLDEAALAAYEVREITALTLTEDFRRKPAHRCWCISHRGIRVDCSIH